MRTNFHSDANNFELFTRVYQQLSPIKLSVASSLIFASPNSFLLVFPLKYNYSSKTKKRKKKE